MYHVLWYAPVFSGGGYCSEAHSFINALEVRSDITVAARHFADSVDHKFLRGLSKKEYAALRDVVGRPLEPAASEGAIVCHSEPGAWAPPKYQTQECPPYGDYSVDGVLVGRTMFETDRLPAGWAERLNKMDKVWVPTHFNARTFAEGGVDPAKIDVVGEAVDVDFFDPQADHVAKAAPFVYPEETPGATRFLSVFKWEERKGWRFLLEAFVKEFALPAAGNPAAAAQRAPEASLHILTSSFHSDSDFGAQVDRFVATELAAWRAAAEQELGGPLALPPIHILPSGVPQTRLPALYARADAFVLPSRGEGWGRPHLEAMSMALPVLATNWSGPTEFLSEANGFPIPIDGLDEIPDGAFRGHRWARPSVSALRAAMRQVVADPAEARARGRRARQDMRERYCPRCVTDGLVARIKALVDAKQALRRGAQAARAGQSLKDEL